MDSQRNLLFRLHIDPQLLGGVLILCGLGLIVLYSAADQSMDVVSRQGIRMAIGIFAMIVLAQVSPAQLARWAPAFYFFGVVLLVGVFLFGTGRGAQRWLEIGIVRFQPSEIMKVTLIMALALYYSLIPISRKSSPLWLIPPLALIFLPTFLVFSQPDLGTSLLILISGFAVMFLAGVNIWYFIAGAFGLIKQPVLMAKFKLVGEDHQLIFDWV